MIQKTFIYGTLVLLAANFLNRIIGFIYQILIIRIIKPEGVGLFNMVLPIYILAMVAATAGIPLAISKLVAEQMARHNLKGAYRILKLCLIFLLLTSTLCTIMMVAGTPLLTKYILPDPKAVGIYICLIPGIIIVSICSAFRGFFQGLQQMTPTAVTQTFEQIARVCAGLFIAYLLLPRGVEYAAVGLSIGVICGEFTGLLTMIIIFLKKRPLAYEPTHTSQPSLSAISKNVFNLAIPVTLTRFISTIAMSVDAVLIPQRIRAVGVTLSQATALYGQLVGIAQTLLFTPCMITNSLATALIPAISDAMAQGNHELVKSRISEAIRITMITGIPCAVVMLILARELCGVLFGYPEVDTTLITLAISGPFLYFSQTSTAILQGLGEAVKPFKNLVLASIIKVIGLYLWIVPGWDIQGAAAALSVSFIIMACLNYFNLRTLVGYRLKLRQNFSRPILASAGMWLVISQLKNVIMSLTGSPLFTLFLALTAGLLTYLVLLLLTGGIPEKDIQLIKGLIIKK